MEEVSEASELTILQAQQPHSPCTKPFLTNSLNGASKFLTQDLIINCPLLFAGCFLYTQFTFALSFQVPREQELGLHPIRLGRRFTDTYCHLLSTHYGNSLDLSQLVCIHITLFNPLQNLRGRQIVILEKNKRPFQIQAASQGHSRLIAQIIAQKTQQCRGGKKERKKKPYGKTFLKTSRQHICSDPSIHTVDSKLPWTAAFSDPCLALMFLQLGRVHTACSLANARVEAIP